MYIYYIHNILEKSAKTSADKIGKPDTLRS